MENKNQNAVIAVVAIVFLLTGGFGVYFWMKYQAMTNELSEVKQQEVRKTTDEAEDPVLKERDQQSSVSEDVLLEGLAPGDAGENPFPETVDWPTYEDSVHKFHFQYPDKYKIVVDNYGWPHAVVHLIDKNGGQSYDVTFETWSGQDDAANEGRGSSSNSFFGNTESPHSGEFVSMTCWNPDSKEDCEAIYSTFSFQQKAQEQIN